MPLDSNAPPAKKPFSLSLSSSNGAPKKTSFNLSSSSTSRDPSGRSLPRRPHQLHHGDDDSDAEEETPSHEVVTGFDTHTGAVIDVEGKEVSKEDERLVIPVTSGNNWRDRPGVNRPSKGKKNLLPKEVQAIREAAEKGDPNATGAGGVETEGPSVAYGISYAQPSREREEEAEDKPMVDANEDANEDAGAGAGQKAPRTEDEIVLQALIRESNGETQGGSDLVIDSATRDEMDEDDSEMRYDETGSFRADVESRPEPATLDRYNAVPVEEFGAALLRGMGWKDGQAIGRGSYGSSEAAERAIRPRIPERRPGFLGIGAKDASGGKGAEMELGAWGKSAMRKGARKAGDDSKDGGGNTEGVYMPVMMRNKQTGDYITEEELAAAQKAAKSRRTGEDEWKERRDRNLEKSGRDKDLGREYRRRDYDDDDDSDRYDKRKSGSSRSSRRDRSLSGDRHSRRRRYEDDDRKDKDDRYYRDRERDRERRSDREKGRDRDRDREREKSHRYRDDDRYSSRHSSSHSSRHGRDRDSDRDPRRRR